MFAQKIKKCNKLIGLIKRFSINNCQAITGAIKGASRVRL